MSQTTARYRAIFEFSAVPLWEEDISAVRRMLRGLPAPHGSTQARVKGLGLSLAIAHATISGYGGSVQVGSSPGVGSTFRVLLRRPDGPSSLPTSSR